MTLSSVISIRDEGAIDLLHSLLEQGVSVRIRVSGRSMQPFLKGDEVVEIASLHARYPKIGDIVLFRDQHGNPLLHRFLWRRLYHEKLYLQTKGDACSSCDSPVPVDQVLGYVRRIVFTNHTVDLRTLRMRLTAYTVTAQTIILFLLQKTNHLFTKQQLL